MASLLRSMVLGVVISSAIAHGENIVPTRQQLSISQNVWPSWYRDTSEINHGRHSSDGQFNARRELQTTRSQMLYELTTRKPKAREDVADRNDRSKSEKLMAVAEYTDSRAYAGYHNDRHRHQTRESVHQGYQQRVVPPAAPTYSKYQPGRRVCTRQVPTSVSQHHRGRQIRLVYTEVPSAFLCCPGWTQVTRLSFGCNKPSCTTSCLNGGVCSSPGKCTCPKGFTGSQCQTDVDECVTEKPCAQLCRNIVGSYVCFCRAGFQLQADRQSCRKNDSDDTAFEARDLENDYGPTTTRRTTFRDTENEVSDGNLDEDYEIILKRLTKLEKQVARSKKRDVGSVEISEKLNLAVENIGEMKRTVENVQLMQQELYDMSNKLKQFEQVFRMIQHLTNRLDDLESRWRICRSKLPIKSGSINF